MPYWTKIIWKKIVIMSFIGLTFSLKIRVLTMLDFSELISVCICLSIIFGLSCLELVRRKSFSLGMSHAFSDFFVPLMILYFVFKHEIILPGHALIIVMILMFSGILFMFWSLIVNSLSENPIEFIE